MATTPLQTIDTHHSSNIHDAQLDYYGKKLATASSDCKINIFEVVGDTQHNQLDSLSGHAGPVWQVGWAHPKFGVLLASCSYDKSVIIHRESPPGTWSPVHKHELHTSSVNRSVGTIVTIYIVVSSDTRSLHSQERACYREPQVAVAFASRA